MLVSVMVCIGMLGLVWMLIVVIVVIVVVYCYDGVGELLNFIMVLCWLFCVVLNVVRLF